MANWYEAHRLNFIQWKIKTIYGDAFYQFSDATKGEIVEAFQEEFVSLWIEEEKQGRINVEFLKLSCEQGLKLLSKSYSFWQILKTLIKQKLGV